MKQKKLGLRDWRKVLLKCKEYGGFWLDEDAVVEFIKMLEELDNYRAYCECQHKERTGW